MRVQTCPSILAAGTAALLTANAIHASGFALHFDGITGEAISAANFDVAQITVESWVNVETVNLDPCCTFAGVLTWGRDWDAAWEFGVVGVPAGGPLEHVYPFFKINWGKNGSASMLSADATFDLNEWNHIAATYDGSTARMYLNGELVDEVQFDVPISNGGDGAIMSIGNNFPGASEFFGGTMDEVRIWNIARSQQQILQTMYRPLLGTEPGLLANYALNEGEGKLLHDSSSNAKHAVIVTTRNGNGTSWVVSTSPVDLKIGDLNGNGIVDTSDLLILLGQWGPCDGCAGDLNGDSVVDVTDMLILLGNWGTPDAE